jgi:hypothetical protein
MNNLYNTVLATYRQGFAGLTPAAQFHFASRLYLWQQEPQAAAWLRQLEPDFTANHQPRAVVEKLLAEPPPLLRQTAQVRAPYFARYPQLQTYEKVLFRLLFMRGLYNIEARPLFYELFDAAVVKQERDALLNDHAALAYLSTFAVNFLYLLERFIHDDDAALPVPTLLQIGRSSFDNSKLVDCQLQCYFFTHCIIAESLFYARPIPHTYGSTYLEMLADTEQIIESRFEQLKFDNKLEFLVCCRILDHHSHLENRILEGAERALSPDGYLVEPLSTTSSTLSKAEHRNVLYLLSQRPYHPLGLGVMDSVVDKVDNRDDDY